MSDHEQVPLSEWARRDIELVERICEVTHCICACHHVAEICTSCALVECDCWRCLHAEGL